MKSQSKSKTYIVCLNPKCPEPQNRCLGTALLHKHPTQCSHHYYPAQQIQNNHQNLSDYPNDQVGKAILRKFKYSNSKSFLSAIISDLKGKVNKLIQKFQQKLQQIYPFGYLQNSYEEIYGLERLAQAIHENQGHHYITKIINSNLSKPKYMSLLLLNEQYDQFQASLDNIYKGMKSNLNEIIQFSAKKEAVKKPSQKYDKKIHYGMLKSKFIASSKIKCEDGVVIFPHLENIASFLPWIYTDKSFTTGSHLLKVCSQRFPLVNNCGFLILQEHDIDTYPYHYFKSLFNKEGRGFQLVEGSEIEYIISQTTIITLYLHLGSNPRAQICDSERRSKYICHLKEDRNYRMGIYGSGWSTVITQLN